MFFVPNHPSNYNNIIVSFFLLAFVFFLGWTDAFRISSWIPLYMVPLLGVLATGIFFLLMRKKIPKNAFDWKDVILLVFLGLTMLSSIFYFNSKSINYLSAYLFVFGVQYFLFRLLLYLYVDIEKLLAVNALAVIVNGSFCTFELLLQYVFYIDIQELMFRSRPATATYLGIFSRSYGFATEPTVAAFYFNTMGPLAVWKILQWSKNSNFAMLTSWLAIFLIVAGFFSTFSSAGYLFFLSSLFLTIILLWRPKVTTLGLIKFILLIGLVLMLIFIYIDVLTYFFDDVYRKLSLDRDYASVSIRLDALLLAVDRVVTNPLTGIGLGMTSSLGEGSPMNWFLSILSELGIITFMVFLSFVVAILLDISKSNIDARAPFLMGALAGFSHLGSMSTFFNPFLWVLLSVYFVYNKKKVSTV